MKKLFVTCALIVGAILIAPGTASAQATGDVDVAITVNGFVILYYYDTVNINIPSTVMAEAFAGFTGSLTGNAGSVAATSALSDDASVSGPGALLVDGTELGTGTFTTTQLLTIENAWSIRGLVNTSVNVVVDNFTDLSGPGTGDIEINASGSGCAGGCSGLNPTLSSPISGDVELELDFSNIDEAGTFSSTATYRITATIS